MSSINNVPFDINRVPTEANKVKAKKDAAPVYKSEALHKAPAHDNVGERRKRKDRRKRPMFIAHERRMLRQRRQSADTTVAKDLPKKKPKGPGQIIDFEV